MKKINSKNVVAPHNSVNDLRKKEAPPSHEPPSHNVAAVIKKKTQQSPDRVGVSVSHHLKPHLISHPTTKKKSHHTTHDSKKYTLSSNITNIEREEIAGDEREYEKKSILFIIDALTKRLGWPNAGILEGRYPLPHKKIYRIREADDGEHIYCIPRHPYSNVTNYNPYDLVYTTPNHAHQQELYASVSATHVIMRSPIEGKVRLLVSEWMAERKLYNDLRKITIFRYFKMFKGFIAWKNLTQDNRSNSSRNMLAERLYSTDPMFQTSLLQVRRLLTNLSKELFAVDVASLHQLSSLDNFVSAAEDLVKTVCEKVGVFRRQILVCILKDCEAYTESSIEQVENDIMRMEGHELKKLKKYDKRRPTKDLQSIKAKYKILAAKYKILETLKQEKSRAEEDIHGSFKHTESGLIHDIEARVARYVRLVDLMLLDALNNYLQVNLSALNQRFCEASENCDHHAMFLCLPSLHFLSGQTDEAANENGFSVDFSPCHQDFEVQLNKVIVLFESILTSYESLLTKQALRPFIGDNAHMCANPVFLIQNDHIYKARLKSMHDVITRDILKVQTYVKKFDVFREMVSCCNKDEMECILQGELNAEQYQSHLAQYTGYLKSMRSLPSEHRAGMFLIRCVLFKSTCVPYPERIISIINDILPKVANRRNEVLLKIIKDGERSISSAMKTANDFVEHLSNLRRVSMEIPGLEKEHCAVTKLFAVAFDFAAHFNAEEKAVFQILAPSFIQLKNSILYHEAQKYENVLTFARQLETVFSKHLAETQRLFELLTTPLLLDADTSISMALEILSFLKTDVKVLVQETRSCVEHENIFQTTLQELANKHRANFKRFSYPKSKVKIGELQKSISELERALNLRELLWVSIREWGALYARLLKSTLSTVDIHQLNTDVNKYIQIIDMLEMGLPPNELVSQLKLKVSNFKRYMPVMCSLRNSNLKKRHWHAIQKLTGCLLSTTVLTIEDLLQLWMLEHTERISAISLTANNEATLEDMINKVINYWNRSDFVLTSHPTRGTAIISGADEIFVAIKESLITIGNVKSSRYAAPFMTQLTEWESKLNLLLRTFTEWAAVQRHWLSLEKVFAVQDIQRQLQAETKMFLQCDKHWREIIGRTLDQPNILLASITPGLLEILKQCKLSLENTHKGLMEYMEGKRLVFARFYFLSNEQLLEVLSYGRDVHSIEPYLPRCFGHLQRLHVRSCVQVSHTVLGVVSPQQECMPLAKELRIRGQVENWLVNLEQSIYDTVKLRIKNSQQQQQNNHDNFLEWMRSACGQEVSVYTQIQFARNVRRALLKTKLAEVLENTEDRLQLLARFVKSSDITQQVLCMCMSLIVLTVHNRDILHALIRNNVTNSHDFSWLRNLRYSWDGETNNCVVEQAFARFTYGYEYLGCAPRIVVTPLTDRAFLTLTTAIHLHLGGGATGPSGTGKSETIKDLAKALGKHCIVFNCCEDLDYKVFGRFLSGICQSGSWVCFDELNRVAVEVLSVIAQQLQIIRAAKQAQALRFIFEARDITLVQSCAFFLTMNPGYAGRVTIPDNLKSLYRPVVMVTPDRTNIAEVTLFASGFAHAQELSRKLSILYELAQTQLSKQLHYDFGLRSMKTVLLLAGTKDREATESTDEQSILISAIRDINLPKLLTTDVKLFERIIEDVFPAHQSVQHTDTQFENVIGMACRELGLVKCSSQVDKVMELRRMMTSRHGIMLVGPPQGGKTAVREILQRALTLSEEDVNDISKIPIVTSKTINPKSMSMGNLYGELDMNSDEWTDGLMSNTLRKFAKQSIAAPNTDMRTCSNYYWLILDGPVDTLWIENLNTLLDDSKQLCLTNGERINMTEKMRIVFETDSLEQVSPATVSRCAMVYLDADELSWQCVVKRWLMKLRDNWKAAEKMREHLWKLFEATVDSALQYLNENKQHLLLDVVGLSQVRMLVNLLDGFVTYLHEEGCFDSTSSTVSNSLQGSTDPQVGDTDAYGFVAYSDYPTDSVLYLKKNPQETLAFINKIFLFCFLWSFGSHFDCYSEESEESTEFIPKFHQEHNPRKDFDVFTRRLFQSFDVGLPSQTETLYSFYVDLYKGSFVTWGCLLANETFLHQQQGYIHTEDSLCHSFLVLLLALNNNHVLLCGNDQVGISSLMGMVSQVLALPHRSFIHPEFILGAEDVLPLYAKKKVESDVMKMSLLPLHDCEFIKQTLHHNTSQNPTLRQQKNLHIFMDDMHVARCDRFGTQSSWEVVKEFVECRGFHDTDSLEWREVENITLIGACNRAVNQKNNRRLISKFNLLCLPTPSAQTLHRIFSHKMATLLDSNNFPVEVRMELPNLISALLGVWSQLAARLPATAGRVHYNFNLCDVTRVALGLLQAHPSVIKTKDDVIQLFVHEMTCEFGHRLIDSSDNDVFHQILLTEMQDYLKFRHNKEHLVKYYADTLFVDFIDNSSSSTAEMVYCYYQDTNKVKQNIQELHMKSGELGDKLVLFPRMVRHVCSVARALRQTNGHMLLIGTPGSGRKCSVQIACMVEDCKFYQHITNSPDVSDFREQLRKVALQAGLHKSACALFINERIIANEQYLQLLCGLLNFSDCTLFFDKENIQHIIAEEKAQSNDAHKSSSVALEKFAKNVRRNLHLIFSVSVSGHTFKTSFHHYRMVFKHCTVAWYSSWSTQALEMVVEMLLPGGAFDLPPEEVKRLLVNTQSTADHVYVQVSKENGCQLHNTSNAFLNFIQGFHKCYEKRRAEKEEEKVKLMNGMSRLEEVTNSVDVMKQNLSVLDLQLKVKEDAKLVLLEKLSADRDRVSKVRGVVEREQQITEVETNRVQNIAAAAQRDLDDALPQLENTIASLDQLNKQDIGEIRSYNNPPAKVVRVFAAVCCVFETKRDWITAKQMLSEPHTFLRRLSRYDYYSMTDQVHAQLRVYTRSEGFNPVAVGKISIACKSICAWLIALDNFVSVYRIVAPKQLKCEQAQVKLQTAVRELNVKKIAMKKVEDQLESMEEGYKTHVEQLTELQDKRQLTLTRLERANVVIQSLHGEKDRWNYLMEDLISKEKFIFCEAFFIAVSVSYLGPLSPTHREEFIDRLKDDLSAIDVPYYDDVIEELVPGIEIQDWLNCGLPHDLHSIHNALIINKSSRWLLLVDPQRQATRWITNKHSQKVKVYTSQDEHLHNKLENSMKLGEVVILQTNLVEFEPSVENLLSKTVEETTDGFRLYIILNQDGVEIPPELSNCVTVVNFVVSPSGLVEQLLSAVALQEIPELEMERLRILKQLVADQQRLTGLEKQYLDLLSCADENILDSAYITDTIHSSRALAETMKQQIERANTYREHYARERQKYRSLAEQSAKLYFLSMSFGALEPIYKFSLQWFGRLFNDCIQLRKKNRRPSSARARIEEAREFSMSTEFDQYRCEQVLTIDNLSSYLRVMANLVCESFYRVVSYAMFGHHQLLLSFYLTASLLLHASPEVQPSYNSYLYYTYSHKSQQIQPLDNQLPSWITKEVTNKIISLQSSAPVFENVWDDVIINNAFWEIFVKETNPMDFLRTNAREWKFTSSLDVFEQLLMCRLVGQASHLSCVQSFVDVHGERFKNPPCIDLYQIFLQSNCRTPVLFIISTGLNPYDRLLNLVRETQRNTLECVSFAHSQRASDVIRRAYTCKGSWVLVENCHLSLSSMQKLEAIVDEISDPQVAVNINFRLWLTTKPHSSFPTSLFQNTLKVTWEPPCGLRSNLQQCFAANSDYVCEKTFDDPTMHHEWRKLVFTTCFLHVVAKERNRFGSFGWNNKYEFVAADLQIALEHVHQQLTFDAHLQLGALRVLVGEVVYQGRITDTWDTRRMQTISQHLFNSNMLEENFRYFHTQEYGPPSGDLTFLECRQMIDTLPSTDNLEVYNMSEGATKAFNTVESCQFLANLQTLQFTTTYGNSLLNESTEELIFKVDTILDSFPELLVSKQRRSKDAVLVLLHHEISKYNSLIRAFRDQLHELTKCLKGEKVISRELEEFAIDLLYNRLPENCKNHSFPTTKGLTDWLTSLKHRMTYISKWRDAVEAGSPPRAIWLPALFYPQGFLTAVLQNHSRQHKISIDKLSICYCVTEQRWTHNDVISDKDGACWHNKIKATDNGVAIFGLFLYGAKWKDGALSITTSKRRIHPLPVVHVYPRQISQTKDGLKHCEVPLYHTTARNNGRTSCPDYITSLSLPLCDDNTSEDCILSGISIVCQPD